MPSRRLVLTGLLGLAAPAPAFAASREAAFRRDADAFIDRALREVGVTPGVSVAFVDGSDTVYAAAMGLADTAPPRRAARDTPFYIASSTKSFTALAVASLAEKGVLDLDAPVAGWLPDSGLPPVIADHVTLRQLLSHSSGLDNFALAYRSAYSGDLTPAIARTLVARTVETPEKPRGTFRYSNAGYNLATTLIEMKTGLSWQALVEQKVLKPLGMNATTPWISRTPDVAVGHVAGPDGARIRAPLRKTDATMQSAGGLVSTAPDMTRWLKAQIDDGVVDGRRVFPAGLVASTHRRIVAQEDDFGSYRRVGYGLGWEDGRWGEEVLIHHFGNFGGSRAHVSFMPGRRLGAAVMVNEDAVAGGLADLIANYLYEWRLGRPDVEARYAAELDRLKTTVAERRAKIVDGAAKIAARPRMLTRPDSAYVGRYESEAFGVFIVAEEAGGLVVRMGPMTARAQAFTQPESIRVELVPGQGQGIVFTLDADGRAAGARMMGYDFARTPG